MATGQYTQFPVDWKTIDASQVPYSNTSSGMTATDVQNAIDELNTDLNAIDASDVSYDNTQSGLTADNIQSAIDEVVSDVSEAVADIDEQLFTKAPVITDTASGAIASFSDGADGYPVKSLIAQIEAIQAGTGDPSPTNVRAISGWSSAKVTRTGKNLLPFPYTSSSGSERGITYTVNEDGTVTLNGTATAASHYFVFASRLDQVMKLEVGQQLIFSNGVEYSADRYARLLYADTSSGISRAYEDGSAITITDEMLRRGIIYEIYIVNGAVVNNVTFKPMIRFAPDSDATYEPFGTTYTISLGQTVYGGTLDVTRGKLTVTYGYAVLNGSENWYELSSGGTRIGFRNSGTTDMPGRKANGQFLCNRLVDKGGSMSDLVNTWDAVWATNLNIRTDSLFADADAFKAWLVDNPLQCVYELDTPIEVDLTPTEINTILGLNNILADTGDIVRVVFTEDTKEYVDNKVEHIDNKMIDFIKIVEFSHMFSNVSSFGTSYNGAVPESVISDGYKLLAVTIKDFDSYYILPVYCYLVPDSIRSMVLRVKSVNETTQTNVTVTMLAWLIKV